MVKQKSPIKDDLKEKYVCWVPECCAEIGHVFGKLSSNNPHHQTCPNSSQLHNKQLTRQVLQYSHLSLVLSYISKILKVWSILFRFDLNCNIDDQ